MIRSGGGALRTARAAAALLGLLLALAARAPAAPPGDEEFTLTADSLHAIRGDGREMVRLEGNVVFRSGPTLVLADHGEYVKADSAGRFSGDVEIFHEGTFITAPSVLFRKDGDEMEFDSGVLIVDGERVLIGTAGIFRAGGETGALWDSVRVIEGDRFLSCDTLRLVSEDLALAIGGVMLRDRAERVRILGEHARLANDRSVVTGSPILIRDDEQGAQETEVVADTLVLDEEGGLEARGRVRVVQGGAEARGEEATVSEDGLLAVMRGSPTVDRDRRRLSGVEVSVRIEEGEPREVLAAGSARMVRDEIVAEEGRAAERAFDEVLADTIRLEFEADSLRRAVAWGDVVSRTERRSLEGRTLERNEARGDSLILTVEEGDGQSAEIRGGATGVYLPRREHEDAAPDSAAAAPDTLGSPPDTAIAVPPDTAIAATPDTSGAPPDTALAAPADSTAPPAVAGADSSRMVHYEAARIDYSTRRRRFVLTDDATLSYQGMVLTAEQIDYDVDRAALLATGEPVLKQGAEEVEGGKMGYNLDARQGIVYGGSTHYETGYLGGDEVVRTNDSTLAVRGGTYTTCDAKPPHYHFACRRMRVYLDDKAVARPVVFYVREVPIIALPFYMLPLEHGRRSGFLLPDIEFGFSRRLGRAVKNVGYYWATNDYVDFAAWGDYYQASRWTAHLESNYALRYLLSGRASVSVTPKSESSQGYDGWDFHAAHNQDLAERTSLTARADFVSGSDYRLEQGTTVNSLNRDLTSDLTLRKNWSTQSLSLALSRRELIDREEITERLPVLTYSHQRFPILGGGASGEGGGPWYGTTYLSLQGNAARVRERIGPASLQEEKETDNFASESSVSLTNSVKLLGILGFSPQATYQTAVYDEDNLGNRWSVRRLWNAGAALNTNVYGTWAPNLGALAKVRHIMTPSVSVRYAPDFDEYVGRFPPIAGIGGTPGGGGSLGISVQHTLQAKVRSGETERSIDNFVTVGQSISRNLNGGPRAWSGLGTNIRVSPWERLELSGSTSYDVYQREVQNVSVQNQLSLDGSFFRRRGGKVKTAGGGEGGDVSDSLRLGEIPESEIGVARGELIRTSRGGPWRMGVSHSYSKGRPGSVADQKVSINLSSNLSPKWQFSYSPFYDLRSKDVISQRFELVRDLHCWEGRFSGWYSGGEWQYFFKINVREYPSLGYERGKPLL